MKKPWNRVNLPVYSISSGYVQQEANMHIITYAQAISMQPKQFICGIYKGTKTLALVQQQPHFVLQLLASHQYNLVTLLGKQSGNQINKIQRLAKRQLLTEWNNFYVLKEALAVMELKAVQLVQPSNEPLQDPDHDVYLCELIAYKNMHEGQPLTIDILREKNIVRM